MKIYISGKITGLPLSEARQRFEDAAVFLAEIGFDPVNPLNNGLESSATWKEHMVADIRLLLDCDAIFMMDGWMESKGASIEYDIAQRMEKHIWFESQDSKIWQEIGCWVELKGGKNNKVQRIAYAINKVMNLLPWQYEARRGKRNKVFARMFFVYHCRRLKMTLKQITKYINRDHTLILYLLRKYEDDFNYNPQFRELAEKVNNLLNV